LAEAVFPVADSVLEVALSEVGAVELVSGVATVVGQVTNSTLADAGLTAAGEVVGRTGGWSWLRELAVDHTDVVDGEVTRGA